MLDLSRDIQSLSNFKRNTSQFTEQMKATGQPIVLTVNGNAELVVQTVETYQQLLEKIEYLETIAGIKAGLADVEAGNTRPLSEFQTAMEEKYDISG